MDKRYQVFVSFADAGQPTIIQEVMQALLELSCTPTGITSYPVLSEDYWVLARQLIDDCDYYLLILSDHYTETEPEGIHYTEMAYHYARQKGKPVIAFLFDHLDDFLTKRHTSESDHKAKLTAFYQSIQQNTYRQWGNAANLGSQISRSLIQLIRSQPAMGWVRADQVPEESTAQEILRLRKQIETQEKEIASLQQDALEGTADLAQGQDTFNVHFSFLVTQAPMELPAQQTIFTPLTWNDIFRAISPLIMDNAKEDTLITKLNELLYETAYPRLLKKKHLKQAHRVHTFQIDHQDFLTIKIQLRALGLITYPHKDDTTRWMLTAYGEATMIRLHAIWKKNNNHDEFKKTIRLT